MSYGSYDPITGGGQVDRPAATPSSGVPPTLREYLERATPDELAEIQRLAGQREDEARNPLAGRPEVQFNPTQLADALTFVYDQFRAVQRLVRRNEIPADLLHDDEAAEAAHTVDEVIEDIPALIAALRKVQDRF
jgi:hypothetical protein